MPNRDGTGPDGLGPISGRIFAANGGKIGHAIRCGFGRSLLVGENNRDNLIKRKQCLEQQLEKIKQQLG